MGGFIDPHGEWGGEGFLRGEGEPIITTPQSEFRGWFPLQLHLLTTLIFRYRAINKGAYSTGHTGQNPTENEMIDIIQNSLTEMIQVLYRIKMSKLSSSKRALGVILHESGVILTPFNVVLSHPVGHFIGFWGLSYWLCDSFSAWNLILRGLLWFFIYWGTVIHNLPTVREPFFSIPNTNPWASMGGLKRKLLHCDSFLLLSTMVTFFPLLSFSRTIINLSYCGFFRYSGV